MRTSILLLNLVLLTTTASATEELIVGSWCESGPANDKCTMVETFKSDGSVWAKGVWDDHGIGYDSSGNWKFNKGELCLNFSQQKYFNASTKEPVEVGNFPPFCLKIESLDSKELKFVNPHTREIQSMYRFVSSNEKV